MATRKSLVYLDDVVQRALKDVLIPILGYRDTSKSLGQYTNEIEYLRKDVTALQIPDKGKIYIHQSMAQPITIVIPEMSYDKNGSAYEDVKVYIEFKHYDRDVSELYAAEIVIPGEFTTGTITKPYCSFCNQPAHDVIKTAFVKVLNSVELKPNKVIQIYFPTVNTTNASSYTRGVVTVYSQNRNVEKTDKWNGITGTEQHITQNEGYEITLGSVSTFDDIPNRDKLVRSNSIRAIEGITTATQEFLADAGKTDKDTAYFEIESPESSVTGTLRFESAAELQAKKDILIDIFGQDWSGVEIQFGDTVKDISGAFKGFGIRKTPRRIVGKNVLMADSIFKDTLVDHISNQAELLAGMPKLVSFNRAFENAPLTDAITEELIGQNPRLTYMNYTFKNTRITNTAKFWEMMRSYVPDRDPSTSSLLPDPTPVSVNIEGNGCYESVTTLPTSLNIPNTWKTDTPVRTYATVEEFLLKRAALLSQYEYDLSTITVNISEDGASLESLFAETVIRKAPKEIIAPNATSIAKMFFSCPELVDIKPSCIAKLTTVRSANSFIAECVKLTTLDQSMFSPLKNIEDYTNALSGLVNMTGPSPVTNGKHLWELQGTAGYPSSIIGSYCFEGSTFDDIASIPKAWGGQANA